MVDPVHLEKANCYHWKDEIEQALRKNAQIRGTSSSNVKESLEIDAENGNTLWADAIELEMKINLVAFEEYDVKIEDLVAYEQISGHLIIDVKLLENFRRKVRFVADGHLVETPVSVTYSTVVYRDSVRILLRAAAIDGLEVKGDYVQYAFLSANNLEKH